ncbi:MAG: alpha/beta fold hydrolase [Acidimicrobiales bacterium]
MFVTADDATLHTVAFGPEGPTVLGLNGWSAAWELWQPTFEHLSTTTRCVSFDTRGTGTSTGSADSISIDTLVDDVFRVLDGRGIDRCVLAGESMGGFVAAHAARRDPSRFAALVLVATPATIGPDTAGALVDGARADYAATTAFFVQLCFTEPDTEHLQPWGRQLFAGADPEVAARLMECCYDAAPDFGAITVPTTVVHGQADAVVPVDSGRAIAAAVPDARLIELPDAGHAPTVTRGREVAEIIRAAVG